MSEQARGGLSIGSMRQFCEQYFPKAHAAKTCNCYPQEKRGILVILPRPGVGR